MSKTVTLRLNDKLYKMFLTLAQEQNRTMSNFIETSVLRFIEQNQFVDDYEMEEIINNDELNKSLKRAYKDVSAKRGRFIE
jgi:predicted transcriptional regulator